METKFLDEIGFRLPEAGLRHYGFSPVGVSCVEVQRYIACPYIPINFLAGVDGVKYTNTLDGATNTLQFLRFFFEASHVTDIHTGRPAWEVGDLVIVNNLPVHRGEAEDALN